MAEEDNGSQDKTEEPSARKLEKAAEDGQVLSSKEMFVFTTLIVGLMILTSIPFFLRDILSVWKLFFLFDLNFLENASPMIGIGKMIKQVIIITLLVGIPLVLTILITQMAVGGINFAPKGFQFKSNRINLFSFGFPITLISVFIFLNLGVVPIANAFSDLTGMAINLIDNILHSPSKRSF